MKVSYPSIVSSHKFLDKKGIHSNLISQWVAGWIFAPEGTKYVFGNINAVRDGVANWPTSHAVFNYLNKENLKLLAKLNPAFEGQKDWRWELVGQNTQWDSKPYHLRLQHISRHDFRKNLWKYENKLKYAETGNSFGDSTWLEDKLKDIHRELLQLESCMGETGHVLKNRKQYVLQVTKSRADRRGRDIVEVLGVWRKLPSKYLKELREYDLQVSRDMV